MSDWIKASDKKPRDGQWCWVCSRPYTTIYGEVQDPVEPRQWSDEHGCFHFDYMVESGVTHYIPLETPELPEVLQ